MLGMNAGQEKRALAVFAVLFAALLVYRIATSEKARTAPLRYAPGAVAASPIREGGAGPLAALAGRRRERFPGVVRDLFRMADAAPRPKPKAAPLKPVAPPPPPVPVKTPEEIAKDRSREDLAKFRFLGYLTDKDSSLFLSKDGELYIAKSGDRILANYLVKETGKDYVILLDTTTAVEARIELSGSGPEKAAPQRIK